MTEATRLATTTPVIEARGLGRTYGRTTAIRGLDFTVAAGRVVGFLGPNGAGKTTTMRIVTGALAATEGSVRVAGVDVAADPITVKRLVGYLPERPPLYDELRVREQLRHAAVLKGVRRADEATERALARTGLEDVAGRVVGHLSKGFRQRVGLAQAIVHDPKVLVLDEPASGLDPVQRVEMRRLVRELAGGEVTVVLSTHVLPEIEQLCEDVIVLHQGRIVLQDRLDALREAGALRVRVARPEGLAEALGALPEVTSVAPDGDALRVVAPVEARPAIARLAAAHDLLELTPASRLEEAFLRATGRDA